MSITGYYRVSRDKGAGGILSTARREHLFCGKSVENQLKSGKYSHIFFAFESNICSVRKTNTKEREDNIMAKTVTINLTWDEIDAIAQILWAAGEEGLAEMLWDAGADLIAD